MRRILSIGVVTAAVGSSLALAGALSASAQIARPQPLVTSDDGNLLTFVRGGGGGGGSVGGGGGSGGGRDSSGRGGDRGFDIPDRSGVRSGDRDKASGRTRQEDGQRISNQPHRPNTVRRKDRDRDTGFGNDDVGFVDPLIYCGTRVGPNGRISATYVGPDGRTRRCP